MRLHHALPLATVLLLAGACGAPREDGASASARRALPALPADVEAVSLLGDTLRAPVLAADARATYERHLDSARAMLAAAPDDRDAWIWVGRRTAYLGRFRESLAHYGDALARFPDEPRLLRHRGHRWLTVRQLDSAEADLARAAALVRGTSDEVEPDGLPNARGIPTSTLQSNVWYHLALARYVRGDFPAALEAWEHALDVANNPDMLVATAHWTWLTLRRLGRDDDARQLLNLVRSDVDVIENGSYLRLLRLYKGELPPDSLLAAGDVGATPSDVAAAYGVGAWHLVEGRPEDAERVFRRIVGGPQWPGFGHLAAEAELARLRR
ncbi:MAG TPA: tetratricopeptide repeat protein [Gemmatimonadaceae bacterium]|nr:tetratricopeptide repeat protein [Gemmatimonadaceae bacterium]